MLTTSQDQTAINYQEAAVHTPQGLAFKAKQIRAFEVRPHMQSRFTLGDYHAVDVPKGFAIELGPESIGENDIQTEVYRTDIGTDVRVMLIIRNESNQRITATIEQLD